MKKFILSLFIIFNFSFIFAASAKYLSEDYNLYVTYNDIITPGDAIFVRLKIITPKNHKKTKTDSERKAALQLIQDKKVIEKGVFYQINKKKTNSMEMLCGIPVSLWLKDGNYSIKVIFENDNNDTKEFILPSTLKMKEFPKEVIELDAKNTAVKTDNSPERMAQIDKLNEILFTTMFTDVYTLKSFTSPTESTRYTAHFGDIRTYAYSNGKTSSSSHYGNDYGVPNGTEVRAANDGRVVMAENRNSTGFSIVIEHLPGLYSLYYHLSELNVKEGDTVKQGELIAKSGDTGLATGPHLHWEMRLNGSAVRPEFFLNDFTFESSK